MVRNYKRKTDRRAWTVSQLKAALRDINSGESRNSVSRKYSIPKRTLCRYLHQQSDTRSEEVVLRNLGNFFPVLNHQQENKLEETIVHMSKCGFGLNSKDVRNLAFQFAEYNKIPHTFDAEKQCAGLAWYSGFRRRHPNLSLRKPELTSMARSTGFNREAVTTFFENLETIFEENQFSPDRIWNTDETGINTV